MIKLLSLMCLTRNHSGLSVIERKYDLDFTLDCFLNDKISDKMRSNFAQLLITAHIDKEPYEKITVPKMARIWNKI
jgi:hypothetical protein